MADIDKLMFRREYFPVEIIEAQRRDDIFFYDFRTDYLPPYHPSMKKEGIDIDLAISILDEPIENTIRDLGEVSDKMPNVKSWLDSLERDIETGKYYGKVVAEGDFESGKRKLIKPFPFISMSQLCIGKDRLSDGLSTDKHIIMSYGTFIRIPKDIVFPEELIKEYEMKELNTTIPKTEFSSPYGWYTHNIGDISRIFYKNMIIALDNAIVKRKYSR